MIKSGLLLLLIAVLLKQSAHAQSFRLDANLELTAARFEPDNDPGRKINTNFRDDDPFNPVRAKLFPHIRLTETFGIEGDFLFDNKGKRFDRTANQPFRVDGLFLSINGLFGNHLNFWAGKIPTPVGTFSGRSYSHINPLIGFPLAYHYKLPYNAFTLSSETGNLFLRDNYFGASTSIYEACWITGVSAFGNIEGIDYMAAVGRGTLTNPEAKANGGVQIAGRIGKTFNEHIAGGISAGIAPYLEHDTGLPTGVSYRDPKHIIAGIDASVHLTSLHLFFEAFYNSWDTPQYQHEKNIHAYAWYLEGQYYFLPEFYSALRIDQLIYSHITDPVSQQQTSWGYNITRIETGVGYSPISELNIKVVIQHNMLDSPPGKAITIYALQGAFRFADLVHFGDSGQPAYE